MSVDEWLNADVVVDVANVRFGVARARGENRGGRDFSLVLLAHALRLFGVRVRSMAVVVPTRPFVGIGRWLDDLRDPSPAADDGRVREGIQRSLEATQQWLASERAALADADLPSVRVVGGALAGVGRGAERSVDEMVALTALDLVWDIPTEQTTSRQGRSQRGVLVISGDDDVAAAAEVARGRPLFLLRIGRDDVAGRRSRRRPNGPWIELPAEVLAQLASPRPHGRAGHGDPRQEVESARRRLDDLLAGLLVGNHPGDPDRTVLLWNAGENRLVLSSSVPYAAPTPAPEGSWEQRHRDAAQGARTIAIIDDYGLLQSGCRVHGMAFLPDPDDVARILEQNLLLPGRITRFAVLPDLDRIRRPADGAASTIEADYAAALRERDAALDASAVKYSADARTAVQRSRLRVLTNRGGDGGDSERPVTERYRLEEKRTVTLLAANVLWALRHTAALVVLLTDRAVLADVLERLPDVIADAERQSQISRSLGERVIRIGVHADPWLAEGLIAGTAARAEPHDEPAAERSGGRLRGPLEDMLGPDGPLARLVLADRGVGTPHLVLLDGALSERLVGLEPPPDGPNRLVRLHRAVSDGRTLIEVVGLDPDEAGLRLRLLDAHSADDEDSLETTLAGVLAVDPQLLEMIRGSRTVDELRDHYRVALRGRRELPCALPVLRAGEDDTSPSLLRARLIARSETGFTLDVDGDLSTTHDQHTVPVTHAFTAYRGVSIEVVAADVDHDGRPDHLLGAATGTTDPGTPLNGLPVVATVVAADRARLVESDGTEVEVALLGAPQSRGMHAEVGQRRLVIRVSPTECYALSSALPHLN